MKTRSYLPHGTKTLSWKRCVATILVCLVLVQFSVPAVYARARANGRGAPGWGSLIGNIAIGLAGSWATGGFKSFGMSHFQNMMLHSQANSIVSSLGFKFGLDTKYTNILGNAVAGGVTYSFGSMGPITQGLSTSNSFMLGAGQGLVNGTITEFAYDSGLPRSLASFAGNTLGGLTLAGLRVQMGNLSPELLAQDGWGHLGGQTSFMGGVKATFNANKNIYLYQLVSVDMEEFATSSLGIDPSFARGLGMGFGSLATGTSLKTALIGGATQGVISIATAKLEDWMGDTLGIDHDAYHQRAFLGVLGATGIEYGLEQMFGITGHYEVQGPNGTVVDSHHLIRQPLLDKLRKNYAHAFNAFGRNQATAPGATFNDVLEYTSYLNNASHLINTHGLGKGLIALLSDHFHYASVDAIKDGIGTSPYHRYVDRPYRIAYESVGDVRAYSPTLYKYRLPDKSVYYADEDMVLAGKEKIGDDWKMINEVASLLGENYQFSTVQLGIAGDNRSPVMFKRIGERNWAGHFSGYTKQGQFISPNITMVIGRAWDFHNPRRQAFMDLINDNTVSYQLLAEGGAFTPSNRAQLAAQEAELLGPLVARVGSKQLNDIRKAIESGAIVFTPAIRYEKAWTPRVERSRVRTPRYSRAMGNAAATRTRMSLIQMGTLSKPLEGINQILFPGTDYTVEAPSEEALEYIAKMQEAQNPGSATTQKTNKGGFVDYNNEITFVVGATVLPEVHNLNARYFDLHTGEGVVREFRGTDSILINNETSRPLGRLVGVDYRAAGTPHVGFEYTGTSQKAVYALLREDPKDYDTRTSSTDQIAFYRDALTNTDPNTTYFLDRNTQERRVITDLSPEEIKSHKEALLNEEPNLVYLMGQETDTPTNRVALSSAISDALDIDAPAEDFVVARVQAYVPETGEFSTYAEGEKRSFTSAVAGNVNLTKDSAGNDTITRLDMVNTRIINENPVVDFGYARFVDHETGKRFADPIVKTFIVNVNRDLSNEHGRIVGSVMSPGDLVPRPGPVSPAEPVAPTVATPPPVGGATPAEPVAPTVAAPVEQPQEPEYPPDPRYANGKSLAFGAPEKTRKSVPKTTPTESSSEKTTIATIRELPLQGPGGKDAWYDKAEHMLSARDAKGNQVYFDTKLDENGNPKGIWTLVGLDGEAGKPSNEFTKNGRRYRRYQNGNLYVLDMGTYRVRDGKRYSQPIWRAVPNAESSSEEESTPAQLRTGKTYSYRGGNITILNSNQQTGMFRWKYADGSGGGIGNADGSLARALLENAPTEAAQPAAATSKPLPLKETLEETITGGPTTTSLASMTDSTPREIAMPKLTPAPLSSAPAPAPQDSTPNPLTTTPATTLPSTPPGSTSKPLATDLEPMLDTQTQEVPQPQMTETSLTSTPTPTGAALPAPSTPASDQKPLTEPILTTPTVSTTDAIASSTAPEAPAPAATPTIATPPSAQPEQTTPETTLNAEEFVKTKIPYTYISELNSACGSTDWMERVVNLPDGQSRPIQFNSNGEAVVGVIRHGDQLTIQKQTILGMDEINISDFYKNQNTPATTVAPQSRMATPKLKHNTDPVNSQPHMGLPEGFTIPEGGIKFNELPQGMQDAIKRKLPAEALRHLNRPGVRITPIPQTKVDEQNPVKPEGTNVDVSSYTRPHQGETVVFTPEEINYVATLANSALTPASISNVFSALNHRRSEASTVLQAALTNSPQEIEEVTTFTERVSKSDQVRLKQIVGVLQDGDLPYIVPKNLKNLVVPYLKHEKNQLGNTFTTVVKTARQKGLIDATQAQELVNYTSPIPAAAAYPLHENRTMIARGIMKGKADIARLFRQKGYAPEVKQKLFATLNKYNESNPDLGTTLHRDDRENLSKADIKAWHYYQALNTAARSLEKGTEPNKIIAYFDARRKFVTPPTVQLPKPQGQQKEFDWSSAEANEFLNTLDRMRMENERTFMNLQNQMNR